MCGVSYAAVAVAGAKRTLPSGADLAPAVPPPSAPSVQPAPPPPGGFRWAPPAPGFTDLVAQAEPMSRLDGLVWALQAKCETGDAMEQRQCRKVRDSRQRSLAGQLMLIDAPAGVLSTQPFDGKTRSVSWRLVGCVSCDGIEIEGQRYQVFAGDAVVTMPPVAAVVPPVPAKPSKPIKPVKGRKPPVAVPVVPAVVIEPLAVEPPTIASSERVFRDEAAAQAWLKKAAHARAQFLVRIPEPANWQYGSKQGISLELVSYRVWAPCDGTVLMASDTVTKGPVDSEACQGDEVTTSVVVAPTDRPTSEVARIMSTAVIAAQECRRPPTQIGVAKLRMTIEGDGTISKYAQTGDFVGTPLATCIDKAVAALKFPGGRLRTTVSYPIMLR